MHHSEQPCLSSPRVLFDPQHTVNHWIDLPLEIMDLIIQYMTENDIQMSRLVCKDWREALSSCIVTLKPRSFDMVYHHAFKNIVELDLTDCCGTLMDDNLVKGLVGLQGLHKLNLADCTHLTDASMTAMFGHEDSSLRNLRWLSLHHCTKITDKTVFALCGGYPQLAYTSIIEYLDLSGCILLTDASTKCIGYRMPYLQDLRLGGYSRTVVVNDEMLQKLSSCTSLETLDISGCIAITGNGLSPVLMSMERLKYLNLWNCMSLDSSSLSSFSQRGYVEGLVELSLRGCHGIDDGVFSHIAHLENLQRLDLRSCELITGNTIGLLWSDTKKLNRLHSLNMKCCFGLTDLRGIARLQSLQNLNLGECWQLTSSALQHLSPLENILRLDLSGCRNIINPLYSGIPGLSSMSRMTTLYLSNCERLGAHSLASLVSLHSLQVLDISGCSHIPPSDVKYLWGLKKLKRVNASHCSWSGCSALRYVAPIESIEELILSACSNLVGTSLVPLRKLKNLKQLVFDGCSSIPLFDRGLCAIASSLTLLTHLSMQNCITIGDNGLSSLGQLKNLQTANFSDCYGITGEGFRYWTNMPYLHTVILQGCSSILDQGIFHLVSNNRTIEEINVKQCRRITDKSISYIAGYLPNIKILAFQASMGITNAGVKTIAREMRNSLTHLTIQFCWQFGDEGAIELARMPWLKYLDLLYSWKITDKAVDALAQSPSLVSVNIFGCHRVTHTAKEKIISKLSHMCRP